MGVLGPEDVSFTGDVVGDPTRDRLSRDEPEAELSYFLWYWF